MLQMTFRCILKENMSGRYCIPLLPRNYSHLQLSPVRCQTERRPSMHTNPNPNPCPRTQCNMPPEQNVCPSHHICKERKEEKERK